MLLLCALAGGGCDVINPPMDMTGVEDLSSSSASDMAMAPGPDFAGDPNSMMISWALWDSMKSGHRISCDDPAAGVTMLTFTATEKMSGKMASTTVACPAGLMYGDATIGLPPNSTDMTYYDITATTVGNTVVTTPPIMDVRRIDSISFTIYLFGFDM